MEKRSLILGLGLSGRSAAELLLGKGEEVLGFDDNLDTLKGSLEPLVAKGLKLIASPSMLPAMLPGFTELVVSPGVKPSHPIYSRAIEEGCSVIGEVELAARYCTGRIRAVGITGTNGKTTTTYLLTHVLNASGFVARAVGNCGVPLTSQLMDMPDGSIAVVELSSFQLERLETPFLEAAALLNITPDHLDRYPSVEAYARAKARIRVALQPGAPLFVNQQVAIQYSSLFERAREITFGESREADLSISERVVMRFGAVEYNSVSDYRRVGSDTLIAAYGLATGLGVAPEAFWASLATFERPAHRMEVVANRGGVTYINDSKGTNAASVVHAVQLLEGPIALIAGGRDKGDPFDAWREVFRGKVVLVLAIGEAQQKVELSVAPDIPVVMCSTLEEAVRRAAHRVKEGGCVLLSPGCASYDMFKNYEERGMQFREIVKHI